VQRGLSAFSRQPDHHHRYRTSSYHPAGGTPHERFLEHAETLRAHDNNIGIVKIGLEKDLVGSNALLYDDLVHLEAAGVHLVADIIAKVAEPSFNARNKVSLFLLLEFLPFLFTHIPMNLQEGFGGKTFDNMQNGDSRSILLGKLAA
jgi:hypothetical protein